MHPTDDTGKKAKAYISPLSLRWRSNFRLKPVSEHPEIISSSKIFHSFTSLLLKENLATSNLTLFLFNFNEWPQRLDCDISKNTSWSIFSYPLRILKTSIKSPCSWDGRPFRHNAHAPRFTQAGLPASVQQTHDGICTYAAKDTIPAQQV